MKNLKRLLSLALTGVMLVGMMAIGASAAEYKDFTDIGEIENTEAVSTMVVLGVINGKGDGSKFDPKGSVTRAEMAKMITVTLFGGSDPKLGTTSGANFDDTKGNWAESYIEYCASQKIIAGVGNRTFNPNGNVTGQQAAKMLLVAIGRNAEAFGYVGSDWALNTMGDAITFGLFENLADIDPSADLTREDAAQMIYNALDVNLWERTPGLNLSTGEVTNSYTNYNTGTLLSTKFKVYTSYGQLETVDEGNLDIVLDNDYDHTIAQNGTAQDSFTKVANDYSSLLGQTVKVLYKATDKVVGVAPLGTNKTASTPISAITAGTGNNAAKVRFGGTNYTLDTADGANANNTAIVIVDGVKLTTGSGSSIANDLKGVAYFIDNDSTNEVTFVDNDNDGRYEYAIITTVDVNKVIYTSKDSIIAGSNTYTFKDDSIAADIARNDYVAARKNLFTSHYDVVEVAPMEATVTGLRSSNQELLMNGDWYRLAAGLVIANLAAGKDAKVYAVNGVIVAGEGVVSAANIDNLVMILDQDDPTSSGSLLNRNVVILKSDGTRETVKMERRQSIVNGNLYTYEETSDGYKFTAAADIGDYKWHAAGAIAQTGSPATIGTIVAKKADNSTAATQIADDAVIFVYASVLKDGKVLTGKELKTLNAHVSTGNQINTTAVGAFTSQVNALTRVTIAGVTVNTNTDADHTELPTVGGTDKLYGMIVSNAYVSGSNTITYEIWNGEENIQVVEAASTPASAISSRTEKTFIKYTGFATDGKITGVTPYTHNAGSGTDLTSAAVWGVTASNKVTFDGSTEVELADKIEYLYIDSSASAKEMGKVAGELQGATRIADGAYVQNVMYTTGSDSKIDFMIIDVTNNLGSFTKKVQPGFTPGSLRNATATLTIGTNNTAVDTSTASLKPGDIVTLTISATGAAAVDVTLGAGFAKVNADDVLTNVTLTSGQTATFNFVVLNSATNDATVTCADHT